MNFNGTGDKILIGDNGKAVFGGGLDLQIYHDGSNSYIQHGTTGNLRYQSGNHDFYNQAGNEFMCRMFQNGSVDLYWDGTKMCQTSQDGFLINNGDLRLTSTGWTGNASCKITNSSEILYIQGGSHATYTTVFRDGNSNDDQWYMMTGGNFRPAANNSVDIGTSSFRVRNIYTNDLCLSNEGSSNDVDGTWGDWTIQEGESDLFLKNNRSGKKYKFNLTEVS